MQFSLKALFVALSLACVWLACSQGMIALIDWAVSGTQHPTSDFFGSHLICAELIGFPTWIAWESRQAELAKRRLSF